MFILYSTTDIPVSEVTKKHASPWLFILTISLFFNIRFTFSSFVGANFSKREWLKLNQDKVQSYEFVRYAFYNTASKVLLVHYIGDETKSGEYLHGNSKKKRNIFVKTSKIVKDNVTASNMEKSTSKIYNRPS